MRLLTVVTFSSCALAQVSTKLCDSPPAKGVEGKMGGIFGISGAPSLGAKGATGNAPKKWDFLCKRVQGSTFATGPEYPKPGVKRINREGTGPYKSAPSGRTDPGLPNHTIYAPLTPPPASVKMPVIVLGEGGCISIGTMFPDLLAEIASHGYLVIANGNPGKVPAEQYTGDSGLANAIRDAGGATSSPAMLTQAVDWVMKGGASKYGNIDLEHIAAAGQSCGGLESYSASYHDDRIKLTILLNSGVIDDSKKCLLKELKSPVAMFLGGPCDVANMNGITDYDILKTDKLKVHLDSGHSGTYGDTNGGKFGKAVLALLDWRFRGDEQAKKAFSDPKSPNSLASQGWYNITSSWFPHYEAKSPYFNDTLA